MSVSLRPLIFHTAIQTGIGALATRFYNGQSPLGKLIFEESSTPIPPLTGALFGAYSALFFHLSSRIITKIDHDEEALPPARMLFKKMKHYAFIIYTGILAATIFFRVCGVPLSIKTSLLFSAAMIGTVVEIMLMVMTMGIIVASGVGICLGCMYCVRWIRR
jgi:hypothetical protein